MKPLTKEHVTVMDHCVGIGGYRNHFCTSENTPDGILFEDLVVSGFATKTTPAIACAPMYHLTDSGMKALEHWYVDNPRPKPNEPGSELAKCRCGNDSFHMVKYSCDTCKSNGVWNSETTEYDHPDVLLPGQERTEMAEEGICEEGNDPSADYQFCESRVCTKCGAHQQFYFSVDR
jgi:hypothetical protein